MILLIHYEKKHGNVIINGENYASSNNNFNRLKNYWIK